MMSEQRYRLEENNQTNELILWEDVKILNVFKSSYDNRKHLSIIVDKLNEQQATIQFLQNEIDELKKDIDIYKYEEKKHSETARKLYEENEQLKEELNNLKKDETMLYHYYTLARYGGD